MHDVRIVQNRYTDDDLGDVELDPGFFGEPFVMLEHFVHFSPGYQRHHEVKTFLCIKEVLHGTQKWIIAFEKHLKLNIDGVYHLSMLD